MNDIDCGQCDYFTVCYDAPKYKSYTKSEWTHWRLCVHALTHTGYLSPEEVKAEIAKAVIAEREKIKIGLKTIMNFDPTNWKGPIYETSQDMLNHFWQELGKFHE